MMGSILQMRRGQLKCNAASQWSYYGYNASDKSEMMLSCFYDSRPSISKAVVKLALPSECACVFLCFSPEGRQTATEDGSLNAEKKQHKLFIPFKLSEHNAHMCSQAIHKQEHQKMSFCCIPECISGSCSNSSIQCISKKNKLLHETVMSQRKKRENRVEVENEAEIERAQVGVLIQCVPLRELSLLANKEKVDGNKA